VQSRSPLKPQGIISARLQSQNDHIEKSQHTNALQLSISEAILTRADPANTEVHWSKVAEPGSWYKVSSTCIATFLQLILHWRALTPNVSLLAISRTI